MAAATDRRQAFLAADSAFHVAVAAGSRNLILQSVIRDLRCFLLSLWRSVDITSEHEVVLGHPSLDRGRDPAARSEAAERRMVDHLLWAEQIEAQQRRQASRRISRTKEGGTS